MLHIPYLKKVIVGSAFAGAFFFASPTAGAQELPAAEPFDPAAAANAVVNHVNDEFARFGAQSGLSDMLQTQQPAAQTQAQVQGQVQTQIQAQNKALNSAVNDAVSQAQNAVQPVIEQANADSQQYAQPLTNPNPVGMIEQATQPAFKPQGTDPNYVWKNDAFSKAAAAKPFDDYVLHRVPGSYFDAPRVPEESNAALTRGKSLYGPGTPLYVRQDTMCTLTAAGTDAAGRKVGITAGHCGNVGDPVSSADSWQVGPTGTIASRNDYLDYSVIEFGSKAEVTRNYNGVHATEVGGNVKPGAVTCKTGVATGTTCGMTYQQAKEIQINQVCAMEGDSGAPVMYKGRIIGAISRGLIPGLPDCRTPLQGALHDPTVAMSMDAILADMNRRGGVGAGFTLPQN